MVNERHGGQGSLTDRTCGYRALGLRSMGWGRALDIGLRPGCCARLVRVVVDGVEHCDDGYSLSRRDEREILRNIRCSANC